MELETISTQKFEDEIRTNEDLFTVASKSWMEILNDIGVHAAFFWFCDIILMKKERRRSLYER